CLVRDDPEIPGNQLAAAAEHADGARIAQLGADLGYVASLLWRLTFDRLRFLRPGSSNLQRQLSGTAGSDDQEALVWHLDEIGSLSSGPQCAGATVGEQNGRLSGIGRWRNPCIETCIRKLDFRAKAESGEQPVLGAVTHQAHQQHDAEDQKCPKGKRVFAIGPRLGCSDPEPIEQGSQPSLVCLPDPLRSGVAAG